MEKDLHKSHNRAMHRSFGKKGFHRDGDHLGERSRKFHRILKPGVEYVDRKLGVGIVREVNDDGIRVAFGDLEKVFPRKHRDHAEGRQDRKESSQNQKNSPVFSFASAGAENGKSPRQRVQIGLMVKDEMLGTGIVSRINERGTYVVYDRTGEEVLYPTGLPRQLLNSTLPKGRKKEKTAMPKGKGHTYRVKQTEYVKKTAAPPSHPAKSTNHGHVHYIEISVGTEAVSNEYGPGIITDIKDGKLWIDFEGGNKESFIYPDCLMNGSIEIIEDEKKSK